MKRINMNVCFTVVLLLFVGCTADSNSGPTDESSEDNAKTESIVENSTETGESTNSNNELEEPTENEATEDPTGESEQIDLEQTASESNDNNAGEQKADNLLSEYSSEEIEFARVWLQLGANQDIDGLYVEHIQAGEPINPNDETSAKYPEDVIQLSGGRLVDGSITYSGNGDGTINIYNVPLRWDGKYPAGEEFYTDIIENTEEVYIDPGEDEKAIELIELIQDQ